jgi:hypothetical protein
MTDIHFEWDEKKETLNRKKHGVSFTEAQTVFADENGLLLDDPDHSHSEDWSILLGLSAKPRLLVIPHTYQKNDAIIRIISARKAARSEQQQYWNRW